MKQIYHKTNLDLYQKSTVEAIYILRKLIERFTEKKKKEATIVLIDSERLL